MESSYEKNNFREDFKEIVHSSRAGFIVEFGIGNGYSLKCWLDFSADFCIIHAYDLFDEFKYNHANYQEIKQKFQTRAKVEIRSGNFYKQDLDYNVEEIDILHVDIANDGDVYQFAVENWMSKISKRGAMVLEGGSKDRDEVEWMNKYNKRKINPYLQSIADQYHITTIEKFPSITIIRHKL